MPGSSKTPPATKVGTGTKGKPPKRRRRAQSKVRRAIFAELVATAAEQGAPIRLGVTTAEAMQECLDRAVALMRFAASRVDLLKLEETADGVGFFEHITGPGGAVEIKPHRWYIMEQEARLEVEKLSAMMTQLGIAERQVHLEEAKAALMVAAIREAALEAGFDHDQIRLLGSALRRRLEDATTEVNRPQASAYSTSQDPSTSRQVAELGTGH